MKKIRIAIGAFLFFVFQLVYVQSACAQLVGPANVVTGIQLWLDGSNVNNTAPATNPANGTLISTWKDVSGNGNNATVLAGQNTPVINSAQINGHDVINFIRIASTLGTIYEVPAVDIRAVTMPQVTIFTVYRMGAHDANSLYGIWGDDNGNWDRFFIPAYGGDSGIVSVGAPFDYIPVPNAGTIGVPKLLAVVYNHGVAGGSSVYFNAQLVENITDNTATTAAQLDLRLGRDGDDNSYNGDIAEMIVYNRILTDCEMREVNGYLGVKYGIDLAFNPPEVSPADTTVCKNTVLTLQASNGTAYRWVPGTGLNDSTIANPTTNVTDSANYSVIITDSLGCIDTFSTHIGMYPGVVISMAADTVVCSGVLLQLQANGGTTYNWTPAAGLNDSHIANPVLTVTDTAVYQVIAANQYGCVDSAEIYINALPAPTAHAGNDTVVCANAQMQLHGSGGNTYYWYPAADITAGDSTSSPTATIGDSTATLYMVATNTYNCTDTGVVHIYTFPAQTVNAGQDTAVCPSATIRLHGSGSSGSYNWYPATGMTGSNTANPEITVTDSATYYLVITDVHRCTDTDSVQVNIIPPPDFSVTPSSKEICLNDSVHLQATGGDTYLWSPADSVSDSATANPVVYPDETITYSVTITESQCHRSATLPVNISLYPQPLVQITEAHDIDCGLKAGQLVVTGDAQSYQWTPPTGLSNTTSTNPIATPATTTLYTITGINEYGCTASDSATIHVFNNGTGLLFVPNAFTPNGDGKNDIFRVLIPGDVTNFELFIFNRYGQMVFQSLDVNIGWDGTFGGVSQGMDTYFYQYKGTSSSCGDLSGKGDVELIR